VKVCAIDETWSGLKLVIRRSTAGVNHEAHEGSKGTKKKP
jgi:hypothetical protein